MYNQIKLQKLEKHTSLFIETDGETSLCTLVIPKFRILSRGKLQILNTRRFPYCPESLSFFYVIFSCLLRNIFEIVCK